MIFKSIKWRLQLWYGLILVVVLAGFGFTAYQLERGRQFRRIDEELQRHFGVLASALHAPRGPGQGRPPINRALPDQLPGEEPPEQDLRPPARFNLSPQAASLFDTNDPNGFYFVIKARDGGEVARSGNVPNLTPAWEDRFQSQANPSLQPRKPPVSVTFEHFRETFQILPPGEQILVGCSIVPEVKELRIVALTLAGVGGLILLLGLAGGWWLVSHALRPIENISAAAVKISAGDLS